MQRQALAWLLASAVAALGAAEAFAVPRHKQAAAPAGKFAEAKRLKKAAASARKSAQAKRNKAATTKHGRTARPGESAVRPAGVPLPPERPVVQEQAAVPLPPNVATAKQAIELVRRGKYSDAIALARSTDDPALHKLVEWALLRQAGNEIRFDRYAAFVQANPDWPSIARLRRRAEVRLWHERRDAATIRGFIGQEPTSAAGRFALARALMSEGDRAAAEREIRAAWQSEMSDDLEGSALAAFGDVLTRADHLARMDRRIGAKDFSAAMRAAKRLGGDRVAVVKACAASLKNSGNGKKLLDSVAAEARGSLGYALCRLHWLVRNDEAGAAVKLVLAAPTTELQRQDTDEWWREIRVLARKLIDMGEAESAFKVVRQAALPANPYYRAELHFMAGWIALRFLGDPAEARTHFGRVDEGSADPIVLARAAYWRGRAAEAAGQMDDMRVQYEAAANYPTAYYGQLARARLGLNDIALAPTAPQPTDGVARELRQAAELLYAIGERDLVRSFVSELAKEGSDAAALAALGQVAAQNNDAQAMFVLGKTALARGMPMELYAFPEIGVPAYSPIGPKLDRCLVYSIVRTESGFDQRDQSHAQAVGLMQVTPAAGRDTARRFGVAYNWKRLVSDPVYNTQMGAAELAALLKEYRGSYILSFVGYNAGRGRVQQWVAKRGDPRDPKVDAVDWVERIPFAETRNYVQRVMENLQVYRARFGERTTTTEPNLHRAMVIGSPVHPASAEAHPR